MLVGRRPPWVKISQRGGSPGAFDRSLSTLLGHAAVLEVMAAQPGDPAKLIGYRENQVVSAPLMECVAKTHAVAERIAAHDYEAAMDMRGGSFKDSMRMLRTLVRAKPHPPEPGMERRRLAVLHGGGPAPGMNTAARVAIRLGIDAGHTMLGVTNGFRGLLNGQVEPMDWMSVTGWVSQGGAELGTSRMFPTEKHFAGMAEQISEFGIDGILMIGGWAGYRAAHELNRHAGEYPEFDLPIVCLPASINNDLPGTELSIGSDTALNSIIEDVDKIKQSAVAWRRCFIVEVMGHDSGYLALMSGIASGAERVYLPEEGITVRDLVEDVTDLRTAFEHGKRLGLIIRGEHADPVYTTGFIQALFEKEGGGAFDVRSAILGHVQQGGDPTPFDRIQATRLAARCIDYLGTETERSAAGSAFIGLDRGKLRFTPLADFPALVDPEAQRPIEQRWLHLRPLAAVMAGRRPPD